MEEDTHIGHENLFLLSIPFGTQRLKRLGRRLTNVVDGQRTPDILAVTFDPAQARIHITYRPVRGGLRASGRPTGFSLRTDDERELLHIYKTTLEGDTVTLHLTADPSPAATYLWYGWGLNPYCNITDGTDAAIPAFGPWKLEL